MKLASLAAFVAICCFAGDVVTFDDGLPKNWSKTVGSWEVVDGTLVGREVAADEHAAASRYLKPIKDGQVSFRFRMNDARSISFGFDPAKGALKKKGHLYSVIVTRNSIALKKHRDKAKDDSKDTTLDTKKVSINENEWVPVVLTLNGETASVKVGDHELTGRDAEFAVAKPGVVFRVSKGAAAFDDVSVVPAK